jgi:hypothetical protein
MFILNLRSVNNFLKREFHSFRYTVPRFRKSVCNSLTDYEQITYYGTKFFI